MKVKILCIGGCLDGQRIYFRGNIFSTPYIKIEDSPKRVLKEHAKFLTEDYDVHIYKIRTIYDSNNNKYQFYVFSEIKSPFEELLKWYKTTE